MKTNSKRQNRHKKQHINKTKTENKNIIVQKKYMHNEYLNTQTIDFTKKFRKFLRKKLRNICLNTIAKLLLNSIFDYFEQFINIALIKAAVVWFKDVRID